MSRTCSRRLEESELRRPRDPAQTPDHARCGQDDQGFRWVSVSSRGLSPGVQWATASALLRSASERRQPSPREDELALQTLQYPLLLQPWLCFRGGCFANPSRPETGDVLGGQRSQAHSDCSAPPLPHPGGRPARPTPRACTPPCWARHAGVAGARGRTTSGLRHGRTSKPRRGCSRRCRRRRRGCRPTSRRAVRARRARSRCCGVFRSWRWSCRRRTGSHR
jgi:hypothetical protein